MKGEYRKKKIDVGREERKIRKREEGGEGGEKKILLKQRAGREILISIFETKTFVWFSQSTGYVMY